MAQTGTLAAPEATVFAPEDILSHLELLGNETMVHIWEDVICPKKVVAVKRNSSAR